MLRIQFIPFQGSVAWCTLPTSLTNQLGVEYLDAQNTGQHCSEMSIFSGVVEGPPIEVLHMKARHDADPSPVSGMSRFVFMTSVCR